MGKTVDAHVVKAAILQPLMTSTLKVTPKIGLNTSERVFSQEKVLYRFINKLDFRTPGLYNFGKPFRGIKYKPFNYLFCDLTRIPP